MKIHTGTSIKCTDGESRVLVTFCGLDVGASERGVTRMPGRVTCGSCRRSRHFKAS